MQKENKSFLIINPFGIGDVIFSTPVIENLRKAFPGARLFYLCNKKVFPVMRNHPYLEKVFVYERDDFVAEQKSSPLKGFLKYLEFIGSIRKERIDCAIDLSLNPQFGFFAFCAGIKRRYGLDYKNRARFLNKKIKITGFKDKHVAEYYLETLKLLNIAPQASGFKIYVDTLSRQKAGQFLSANSITANDLVIGLAACGGDAFGKDNRIRRWPPENFAALIDLLAARLKAKIFIFAGPKERSDVLNIMDLSKNKKDVYEFSTWSLEDTAALLERCDLFIGNDTGISKIADGLDKKIIAFYGPLSEKVYGPYPLDKNRTRVFNKNLPCGPCYSNFRIKPCGFDRQCLRSITVEEVFSCALELLEERVNATA